MHFSICSIPGAVLALSAAASSIPSPSPPVGEATAAAKGESGRLLLPLLLPLLPGDGVAGAGAGGEATCCV